MSPDGQLVLTHRVERYELVNAVEDGKRVRIQNPVSVVTELSETATGRPVLTLPGEIARLAAADFSLDGERVAAAFSTGTIVVGT